jgi:hypothetical protein
VQRNAKRSHSLWRTLVDWNAIAALAGSVTALAAIVTALIVFRQVKQEARLTRYAVGIETLLRLEASWEDLARIRAHAAAEIQAGKCGRYVVQVIDFFDTLATLTKKQVLDKDLVWHTFYWPMANYWAVCQDFVRETQNGEGAATWADYCEVMNEIKATEAERSRRSLAEIGPSQGQVNEFMADEKSRLVSSR